MSSAIASDSELLTVPEVAERLKLNRYTIYRKVEEGELTALRLGRAKNAPIRILASDVADFIRESTLSDQLAAELEQLRSDLRKAAP